MKKIKIIPRSKQVLVKTSDDQSRESEYGIITPTNVEQEKKAIGIVIAVGAEIKDIKKGDKIIYGAYAGEKIKLRESSKEVDYVLLFDEDILAFIEE